MNYFSKNVRHPILIVDKQGTLGDKLSQELAKQFVVVYACQKKPTTDRAENVIFSEYTDSIPVIPNSNYSYILVVDEGIWTKGFLSEFIKKARKDKSQLLFLVSLFNFGSFYKSFRKIKNQGAAKIIIFGEIFDRDKHLPFIRMAIRQERIQVNGDGLSKVYPVFLDDAVFGIIDAMEKTGSIFYLFPKYPPTQISLARMIQKAAPAVQIDFTISRSRHSGDPDLSGGSRISFVQGGERFWTSQNDKAGGKYLLPDNYSLEKRIRELTIENLSTENNARKDAINFSPKRQNRHMAIGWFLLFLLFLILLPLIAALTFSFLGFVGLGSAKTAIEKGNLSDAQKSTNASKAFFNLAGKSSHLLLTEAKLIGFENRLMPIIKKINLGQDLSLASSHVLDASGILWQVFTNNSFNPKEDFTKGTNLLKNAVVLFRQNEKEEGIPKDLLVKIKSMDDVIKIAENTIDVLPSLFGFDGKKTYLILFQNNMELRPAGGFIGSYGLLNLDSGRIVDFSIHDVYDADGQLKEHVEPPFPIRRHLKLQHWYLRDSNFDVDFARSGQSAAVLLSKELGIKVDGVIGIDASFVKNILEAVGPVYVSDYRQRVDSDNLFGITQSHAEKNFFPGSRQKKNFLGSLFNSIQLSMSLRENLPYLVLVKNIARSISEKHLLFAFNDKGVQDLFAVNNWSSTLTDGRKEELGVINDFLGINEANLGVNKANFFVKRKLSHNVDIDEEGSILEIVKIEYENFSKARPGGDYINYLRIILPLHAVLLSISFDGVYQELVPAVTDFRVYEAKDFVEPLGLEVERYEQDGKTIYGFLANVKAGKSKEIKIEYKLSQKISLGSQAFSYSLGIFKQPGTDSYPYSFSLAHPENLRLINGKSSFSGMLATDMDLTTTFIQR